METSGLWTTSGTPSGHQVASYSQAVLSIYSEILAACSGHEGVAPGYLNELAGTVTGANTVAINTGGAVVDGKFYHNSASESVNIPSATAGNTRIDRIVLRATWASFTVELHRIAGVDAGSPTAPAITQTSGTTYDIMLYQATVTDAGVVTLTTDERVWAVPQVDDSTIETNDGALRVKDLGVVTAKLAANALSADAAGRGKMQDGFLSADATGRAKMANNFVNTDKILNSNVTAAKLATDAVETAKIKDLNVTTGKLAANALSADAAGRAKMADHFVNYYKLGIGSVDPSRTSFMNSNGSSAGIFVGYVASNGTGVRLPSSWSSARDSTGIYTITHDLGATGYIVVLTANTSSERFLSCSDIANNTFSARVFDDAGTARDVDFSFILIRY